MAKMQFSLRTIFVVTAVVAVVFAEAVAFPGWLADLIGLSVTLLLPSAFVAQIVYAFGAGRAFGVGALTAWIAVAALIHFLGGLQGVNGVGINFSIAWCLILAGGGVSVLVRWLNA
ncbi:MAG: hypothetical protein ACREJM_08855 [Candidatus Saccharimonadales bacterium]